RFTEDNAGGIPLGLMPGAEYEEYTFALKPGQVIVVGTDGVWEMPNTSGEQYGKDRLRAAIRSSAGGTAGDGSRAILNHPLALRGDGRRADDVTFVVVKVPARSGPA